jgi:hypothetical protein
MTFLETILGLVAFGAGVFLYAAVKYMVLRHKRPRQQEIEFPTQKPTREADRPLAAAGDRR